MDKKPGKQENKQKGGVTDKEDTNAGSGAFNQGSEQDPNYEDGTPVSDEEKATGHLADKGADKEIEKPSRRKQLPGKEPL